MIITTQQEMIRFIKQGFKAPYPLSAKILMKISDNSYLQQDDIPKENALSKLKIHFIDHSNGYSNGYCQVNSENFSNKTTAEVKIPISLSNLEAHRLGSLILNNALIEDKIVIFNVPLNSIKYEPTDLVILNYINYNYQIRIVSIKLRNFQLQITGIFDDFESYYQPLIKNQAALPYEAPLETKFIILLPFIFEGEKDEQFIAV